MQILTKHTFPCVQDKLRTQVEVTLLPGDLFETLVPWGGAAAYFHVVAGGVTRARSQIVMPDEDRGEALRLFSHELGHLLSDLCHAELPTWVAEGMATFVETAAVRRDMLLLGVPSYLAANINDATTVTIEGMPIRVLPADELPSVKVLTQLEPDAFYAAGPDKTVAEGTRRANYAAAAILVRALEVDRGELKRKYRDYLRWLAEGRPAVEAQRMAFHGTDLQAVFDAAVKTRRWSALVLHVESPSIGRAEVAPMSIGDAEAHLAQLWGWDSPQGRLRARAHVRRGLALEPSHIDLKLMDLQLDLAENELDAASKKSDAWLSAQPDSIHATRAAARVQVMRALEGRPVRVDRLATLHATLARSEDARDLDLCAQLSLLQQDHERARSEVDRALAADAGCASCQLTLAHVEGLRGRWTAAEAALQRALLLAVEGDKDVWRQVREALAYVRQQASMR